MFTRNKSVAKSRPSTPPKKTKERAMETGSKDSTDITSEEASDKS